VLVPLLAAGCAFVFVFVLLPRPSRADDFALRVLSRLERVRISGSVIHLRGATIIARCTVLHDRRELISLARGGRIVVRETHVHLLRRERVEARRRRCRSLRPRPIWQGHGCCTSMS
jgi:hypothetical protein